MLVLKGRARAVGHAGMTGCTNEAVGGGGGWSECTPTLLLVRIKIRKTGGLKDTSPAPLIGSEAELSGLLCGHCICLAICPLEER